MDTRSFILPLTKQSKNILHTHLKQATQTNHEKKKSSCKTGAFSWKKPDYFNLVSL